MDIDFDQLDPNVFRPARQVEVVLGASAGLAALPDRIAVVGQMTVGAATPGIPRTIANAADSAGLFGPGSMLDLMLQRAIPNVTGTATEVVALPLADAVGSVPTIWEIGFSGTATQTAPLTLWAGEARIRVNTGAGATHQSIALALEAEINAAYRLPADALATGGVTALTITAPGTGYTLPPTITITAATGDSGAGATATATVSGGGLATVTITAPGAGYSLPPAITITPNPADAGAAGATITAAITRDKLQIVSRNTGSAGGDLSVFVGWHDDEVAPPGLTVTATKTQAGAGDPDMGMALAALAGGDYATLIIPYSSSAAMEDIESFLTEQNDQRKETDGVAWVGVRGTYAAVRAWADGRNSKWVTALGVPETRAAVCEWVAAFAARQHAALMVDPSRPVTTLQPQRAPAAPKPERRYTGDEREQLLRNGISTFTVDPGGAVAVERTVMTYRVDAFGQPDYRWLDITEPAQARYIRRQITAALRAAYPNHKLFGDSSPPPRVGQAYARPKDVKRVIVARAALMKADGVCFDEESFQRFAAELRVGRSSTNRNAVVAAAPWSSIPGLYGIFVQIRLEQLIGAES